MRNREWLFIFGNGEWVIGNSEFKKDAQMESSLLCGSCAYIISEKGSKDCAAFMTIGASFHHFVVGRFTARSDALGLLGANPIPA